MAHENVELIHRWFEEVWNKKNPDAVAEMMAEDCIAYGLNDAGGNAVRGHEGFRALHQGFVSAYPDLKVTVEDTLADGDKVAARCTVTGTHGGHGIGVAPTDNPVEFSGMTIVRIKDGKIV